MERMSVELAHDLRLPLQLIYSCAQMIQLELGDLSQPAGKYVDMLLDNVQEIQRMLNRALEEDRAARTANALNLRPVDLAECVRGVCTRCRVYGDTRGVELAYAGNVASLWLAADEEKVERILLNLISNALKFTPPGGRIAVRLTAMGDFAEISVTDSGCGISPDRLPYIFLQDETEGGHGYGLGIARAFARQMGGDVSARSEPGQGSAFTLRLPVRSEKKLEFA